jgi:ribosomal protein L44E
MQAVFASHPGGLHDCGACLGLLFWLGLPIVVLVQTARALHRPDEADRERELERGEFGGCVLLATLCVGLWMVVVSASEGWSSDPLYFAAVIVAIPVVWLAVSSLAAKRRERRRIRENALQEKRKREEIEYKNTHCPVCNATDIESKTYESTYEGTEEQTEYEDRYDREGGYIGHSEHRRSVPTTKRRYWIWLTCTRCGNGWSKE